MPIKPENRARYPKTWPAIRERILARAGNRCEGSPDAGHMTFKRSSDKLIKADLVRKWELWVWLVR